VQASFQGIRGGSPRMPRPVTHVLERWCYPCARHAPVSSSLARRAGSPRRWPSEGPADSKRTMVTCAPLLSRHEELPATSGALRDRETNFLNRQARKRVRPATAAKQTTSRPSSQERQASRLPQMHSQARRDEGLQRHQASRDRRNTGRRQGAKTGPHSHG
jgi:hypothetical protein